MARRRLPELSAPQVVRLTDELLANAERLLQSAVAVLEVGQVGLARALATLGMEESGKAIALHERRVTIVRAREGEAFVDASLRELWNSHTRKLAAVHRFLRDEEYWFGTESSDPEENAAALGAIEEWIRAHDDAKQQGFYVDVDENGEALPPSRETDAETVRQVLSYVNQIGWQLRLGEHIEGKAQLDVERTVPPASPEKIAAFLGAMPKIDSQFQAVVRDELARGRPGGSVRNAAYRFTLPEDPSTTMGALGHEAEDRELLRLAEEDDDNLTTG